MQTNNRNRFNQFRRTNQPIPNNIKNALRSIRRDDNQETIVVSGPNDPKIIRSDILVTKTVEVTDGTTTPVGYTYNSIYKLLDNGATPFFTGMRIISAHLYGAATDTPIKVFVSTDSASYVDHGVAGSRRPAIHLRFAEVQRITWTPTTSTTNVLTAQGNGAGFCIQFTIQVRGDPANDS